jgi:hypothetical protein
VKRIEDHSFSECTGLAAVAFEPVSTLSHIDCEAFGGCSSLTSLWIPSSVEVVGFHAFDGCSSLSTVIVQAPSRLWAVGHAPSDHAPLLDHSPRSFASVAAIRSCCFNSCPKLSVLKFEQTSEFARRARFYSHYVGLSKT